MENQEELKACNVSQDLIQSKQIRAKGKCTESYKLTNFPTYNAESTFCFGFFLNYFKEQVVNCSLDFTNFFAAALHKSGFICTFC